jgi:hypothetical protein
LPLLASSADRRRAAGGGIVATGCCAAPFGRHNRRDIVGAVAGQVLLLLKLMQFTTSVFAGAFDGQISSRHCLTPSGADAAEKR